MRAVYVPLPEHARRALVEFAGREWRDPRDQAAKFVVEGLRAAGALPAQPAESTPQLVHGAREPGLAAL